MFLPPAVKDQFGDSDFTIQRKLTLVRSEDCFYLVCTHAAYRYLRYLGVWPTDNFIAFPVLVNQVSGEINKVSTQVNKFCVLEIQHNKLATQDNFPSDLITQTLKLINNITNIQINNIFIQKRNLILDNLSVGRNNGMYQWTRAHKLAHFCWVICCSTFCPTQSRMLDIWSLKKGQVSCKGQVAQ